MHHDTLTLLRSFTILYAEDEPGIRRRVGATLRYYFGTVYEASDGDEGLDLYYRHRPDIILTDIEMPRKGGIAMVAQIRETDHDTPIVMLTAYTNEEYLLELINLNINHYILKPVHADKLLGGIQKALGNRLRRCLDLAEDLCLDREQSALIHHQNIIPLRKREKHFLELLHANDRRITLYDHIEEHLWPDRPMSPGALKTFIKELRAKLPPGTIENIPLEGYRLTQTH